VSDRGARPALRAPGGTRATRLRRDGLTPAEAGRARCLCVIDGRRARGEAVSPRRKYAPLAPAPETGSVRGQERLVKGACADSPGGPTLERAAGREESPGEGERGGHSLARRAQNQRRGSIRRRCHHYAFHDGIVMTAVCAVTLAGYPAQQGLRPRRGSSLTGWARASNRATRWMFSMTLHSPHPLTTRFATPLRTRIELRRLLGL
jgi:hypothetical protein